LRSDGFVQSVGSALDHRAAAVLFVNGIPVATLEFKNLLTGSTFKHAEKQYKSDRPPAGEPLLTFRRGALVHFALDEDNVSMTTRLQNGKTRFLPFNRGHEGGAGNPEVRDEFRVAYLYKDLPEGAAVFGREKWLSIIGRFVHLEKDEGKEALIFPRFHQLDAVTKMMDHARTLGPGNNYLIQHSAGSGKSNTIGWTAHQAINLHDAQDRPIFDTAIIVTDCIVLDRQLQNTVSQFEQTKGVVKKIDGTSRQLKEAIQSGLKRRHSRRNSSRPSDRMRVISPSIAPVSTEAMARRPPVRRSSASIWSAGRQAHDKCVRPRLSPISGSSRASCAPQPQRSRGPSAAANPSPS
jgi:type I site-specific restriction-modification system R (restriction) subunit